MIPSELLEDALALAQGLCLRQLAQSEGTRLDFRIYAEQMRALSRVTIGNRSETYKRNPAGLHASIAAGNEWGRAATMFESWSDEDLAAMHRSLKEAL